MRRLLTAILVASLAAVVPVAAKRRADLDYVNGAEAHANAASASVTFTAFTGDTILLFGVGFGGTCNFVPAYSDGVNTYTTNALPSGGFNYAISSNITGGSLTFTATCAGGTVASIMAAEYAGNLSIDQITGANGVSGTYDSTSVTTTAANTRLVCNAKNFSNTGQTAASGWSQRQQAYDGTLVYELLQDQAQTSTGSYNCTGASGGPAVTWFADIIALKASGSPPFPSAIIINPIPCCEQLSRLIFNLTHAAR